MRTDPAVWQSCPPQKTALGRAGLRQVINAVSRQKKKSSWGLGSSGDKNMRMYVTMPASHARAAPNVPAHLTRSHAPRARTLFPKGVAVSP